MGRVCFSAVLVAVCASLAIGQTSRGTVTGIVSDAQAGVVQHARVELTGIQTGVKRSTTTNEVGLYRFDAVDPGDYSLAVSAEGFRTLVLRGIPVEGGQLTSRDVSLEVGEARTVVEVSTEAQAVLQVEAPVRGGNIPSATLTYLPMASRDAAAFALTLPGVSTNRFGWGVGTFSVNGSRGRSNNFMLDGTDNNDASVAGQLIQVKDLDAVAEVSVLTSNFDAEFGRAAGAVVNTITRSGTNDLHGGVKYILDVTNDEAITNTQSLNAEIRERGKPFPGTEQWYGFHVGGPVRKDRTFFFGSFQDQRRRSQNTNNFVIPTAAGRATLTSIFPKGASKNIDLYNEVTGSLTADSQPFNVTMGDGRPPVEFGTAIVPYAYKYLGRQYVVRVDHQISESDQLSGRYLFYKQSNPVAGANFPGFETSYLYPQYNLALTETHIFSPSTANEFRPSFNRANLDYPLDPANPLGKTMARYTIGGGITAIGVATTFPQGRITNNYLLQDTVSHTRGTHSLRFGVSVNQQRSKQLAPGRERGEVAYGSTTGFSNFANFADDFGGSNGTVYRDFGGLSYYPNFTRHAYFAQDRWRATRDLTLTLGVRYEYFGTPMNAVPTPAWSGLFTIDPVTFDGPYRLPNKVRADKNNWAPVLGIAWAPSTSEGLLGRLLGEKKGVIRAGYMIGYDSFFNNITSNAKATTPNILSTTRPSAAADGPRGIANWSAQVPTEARAPSPLDSQTLMPGNLVNPYLQRWSAGVQRELPANFLLDVSYVGSKGTRLYVNEDMNPVVPENMRIVPSRWASWATMPAANRSTRYDPLQGSRLTRTHGGDSNYHALQMEANRRFSQGLQMKATYTWSKLIDNASEIFGQANTNSPQNTMLPSIFGGLTLDRGLSMFDRAHRATFSYRYELPFFTSQRGALGRVLGGWQISGFTVFESGVPLTVYNGYDADGIGGNYDRPLFNPNGTPGVRAQYSASSPTGYVNPEAGNAPLDPARAMYIGLPANSGKDGLPTGNLGRSTLRVPGINNFDMSFSKSIRVTERFSTHFRADFYNIWNHPQFGVGSESPFSPAPGAIAASVGTSPAGRFLDPRFMDGGGRVVRYEVRVSF